MSHGTCAVPACPYPVRSRGWCSAHYIRWLNDGDPGADRPVRRKPGAAPAKCSIETCSDSARARGWCMKHWQRWRQHGDPLGGRSAPGTYASARCKIEDCDETADGGLGWCRRHYQKYWLYGDPLTPDKRTRRGMPLGDRIEARVIKTNQCWFWLGALSKDGYGHISINGKAVGAHRASYMTFVGPIPEGMVIDHLCRNRACVRPDHLEAVPQEVNVRRGASSNPHTHCNKGHEFTPENTRVVQVCLTCDHDAREQRARRRRAALRAAA